ncbi:hypothetical protein JZ751_024584 [Albula glossodonta]|uniref:Uncharacterized protein n=1 Tax=Albula glossodonta TaxID=121402 RepID=A0A8T2PDS6_9TELE|nr:hypothetical protein JZ751_024584 [Albula glossodonta]
MILSSWIPKRGVLTVQVEEGGGLTSVPIFQYRATARQACCVEELKGEDTQVAVPQEVDVTVDYWVQTLTQGPLLQRNRIC